jgi:hypothetical protein
MSAVQGKRWRMSGLLCLALAAHGCAKSESLHPMGGNDGGADRGDSLGVMGADAPSAPSDDMPGDVGCVGPCKQDGGPTADVLVSADVPSESSPTVDAGPCTGEISDLDHLGWIGPCPSLVDAGVPTLSCQGPGVGIYGAVCGQRQTLSWGWGTHGMTCFYEQGVLVGLTMSNDTLGFCAGTSFTIEVGSVERCPTAAETLLLDCNPFSDGGFWTNGAG